MPSSWMMHVGCVFLAGIQCDRAVVRSKSCKFVSGLILRLQDNEPCWEIRKRTKIHDIIEYKLKQTCSSMFNMEKRYRNKIIIIIMKKRVS